MCLKSLLLQAYVMERLAKLLGIMTHYGVLPTKECTSAADQRILSLSRQARQQHKWASVSRACPITNPCNTLYYLNANHISPYTESQSVLS